MSTLKLDIDISERNAIRNNYGTGTDVEDGQFVKTDTVSDPFSLLEKALLTEKTFNIETGKVSTVTPLDLASPVKRLSNQPKKKSSNPFAGAYEKAAINVRSKKKARQVPSTPEGFENASKRTYAPEFTLSGV